jgi:hypothetical protein
MLYIKFDFIRFPSTTKESRWKLRCAKGGVRAALIRTINLFSLFFGYFFTSDSLLLLKFVEIIISFEKRFFFRCVKFIFFLGKFSLYIWVLDHLIFPKKKKMK